MFFTSAKISANGLLLTFFQAFVCFCIFHNTAYADWNSGITIEDASTRIAINIVNDGVQLTINLSDEAVTQLLTANKTNDPGSTSNPQMLSNFAMKSIELLANQKLNPTIKINSAKSSDSLLFEVFFPFTETHPEQIEVIPDFTLIEQTGKKYFITISHQGLPVIDHGVITKPETLILNWEDPWYSHFVNPKLKRDHNDPVMAFLYIEPQQIKSETIVRIKEMAHWTDLGLRDEVMIYPDEFAKVKQKIAQYLLTQNNINSDSKLLSPTLKQVDYIRMGAADIQAYEPQQAQRQVATLIGVSMIYQSKEIPNKVSWQWSLFNKKIQRVAIRAYDPAGLFDSYVTPKYPVFEWENMMTDIDLPFSSEKPQSIPVQVNKQKEAHYFWLIGLIVFLLILIVSCKYIKPNFRKYGYTSVVLFTLAMGYYLQKTGKLSFVASNTKLDKQMAEPLLNQLLWNVYQAFESSQEDHTYEKLAYSVEGDLRETLYLQNRQAFLVQDGAQSKVNSIKINRLTDLSSTFNNENLFDCEWIVIGDVIHWGHQHRRENLYRAQIKLTPVNGYWKIVELQSIDQQRVDEEKNNRAAALL